MTLKNLILSYIIISTTEYVEHTVYSSVKGKTVENPHGAICSSRECYWFAPVTGQIKSQTLNETTWSHHQRTVYTHVCKTSFSLIVFALYPRLTFFNEVYNITGIKTELVHVLTVVLIQRTASRTLRSRRSFGPAAGGRRRTLADAPLPLHS